MKKNLRLLCLSLFTASLMTGFAQENVTEKLNNANFEKGVAFWDVEYENQIWSVNRNKAKQTGFYGFSGTNLEVWNGSVLKPNSISQTVSNLPNGTYVFGAYLGASRNLATPAQPTKAEGMTDAEYKASEEYKKWKAEYDAIRAKFVADSVFGVKMFANLDEIPVATEHPDRGEEKRHTVKFNIATKVTDGNLTVGLDVDSTNTIYVCWDEAELYYFGNMDAAAALTEMAKIDAKKPLAIADTVVGKYMNADTLKFLNEGIAAAKAVATAADFTAADEKLRWGIVLGNRSVNDYNRLSKKIAASNALVNSNPNWFYEKTLKATQDVIAYAQGLYDAKTVNRAQVNELIDTMNYACNVLRFDSLELAAEELALFLTENAAKFGNNEGEYSIAWKDSLERLAARVNAAMSANWNADPENLVVTAVSAEAAAEDVKLIKVIAESIQACVDNPNGAAGAFQPTTLTGDSALGAEEDGAYVFKSDLMPSGSRVESIKVTFLDSYCPNGSNKGNPPFVAISEFYVYDENNTAIALTADCFASNASDEAEGKDFGALCDGKPATFWHSDWHGKVKENHYLEVTIPNGVNLNSFYIGWRTRNAKQNIPKSVEVTITEAVGEYNENLVALESKISEANSFLGQNYFGTGVGFYNANPAALRKAIEDATALVEKEGATDDEYIQQTGVLTSELAALADVPITLPQAGKAYRLINANRTGFNVYGLEYVMTAKTDTANNVLVRWEPAHPDSTAQLFEFEVLESEDGSNCYALKNQSTQLYVGTPVSESGDYADDVALFEIPDTVTVTSIGEAKFTLDNHGLINTKGFNWGGNPKSGVMCKWNDPNDVGSQWYICEMSVLPLTALVEGTTYNSPVYYVYEAIKTVSFTANKETAFENFAVKGLDGQVIEAELEQIGTTMLVTFPAKVWAFSFSFDNKEGVTEVGVGQSKLGALREAYDAAVALAPEEGDLVAQFSDLSAYNAALKGAEEYFAKGGTDEQIDAAIKAINAAVKGLVPNKPAADKAYYIISALEAYEENHVAPMAIYAKQTKNAEGVDVSYARWTYLSTKSNYHWRFIEAETRKASSETEADTVFYNIQNVETNGYLKPVAQSTALELTDSVEKAGKYAITILQGTIVNINLNNKIDEHKCLHTDGHGGGAGKGGSIVGWAGSVNTASSWYISEVEAVLTDLDFTVVDDNDEEIAPVVKGIYDLYGRRVVNPTAPGIYIVDGKKRVIK